MHNKIKMVCSIQVMLFHKDINKTVTPLYLKACRTTFLTFRHSNLEIYHGVIEGIADATAPFDTSKKKTSKYPWPLSYQRILCIILNAMLLLDTVRPVLFSSH